MNLDTNNYGPLLGNAALKWRRTISGDLIVSIVIIVTITSVLITSFNFWMRSEKAKSIFESKASEYLHYLQDSLEVPIWTFDEQTVEKICDSFFKNELVSGLRVKNYLGETLFDNYNNDDSGLIARLGQVIHDGNVIGTIEIALTLQLYKENNFQLLKSSIINMLVTIFMLIGATTILLRLFLRNPLNYLNDRIDRIAAGDYAYKTRRYKQREIETIISKFNVMSEKVQSREKSLNEANVKLKQEVGERKNAEKALRKSEERYRTIIETAKEGVWIIDTEARTTFVNQQMADMLGYTVEEMMDKTVFDLLDDNYLEIFKEKQKRRQKGHSEQYDLKFCRKDGSDMWGIIKASPLFDSESNVIGSFGMITDVTNRKQAQDALLQEKQFTDALLESMPGILYAYDKDRRLFRWNRNAEIVTEYSFEQLKGMDTFDIVSPKDHERTASMVEKVLTDGHVEFEIDILTKSDKEIPYYITGVRMDIGDESFVVGVGIDLTEQKRSEEISRNLEMQIRQFQKMESMGTLAGGIAHDFNNILSSIFGFTELAKVKAAKGGNIEKELDEVLNAGFRARDLIQQILLFSRQADIQKNPIEIVPLVKEALKFLRASISSTIEIKHNFHAPDSIVMADSIQIHQVLMNLCTNAAYAMKEKGGVLDVRLDEVSIEDEQDFEDMRLEPGKYVRLTVADTGQGIPKQIMDRIFDPFFTTKKREEGTGMGLSVVHGIVKETGGAISVYSESNKGTVFHVLLPKLEGEAVDSYSVTPVAEKGSGRILFVDDEEGILESGRKILEHLGYEVVATDSSVEALALFKDGPEDFDLVLTDMTMPGMTGLELSKQLIEIRADIPIVLCTGFNAEMTTETIKDIGIQEMIMKPMLVSELAKVVGKAMNPENK